MSNDFDEIKRAFKVATPNADNQRRTKNIENAAENFEKLQGISLGARHKSDRGMFARVTDGVMKMLTAMTTRGGLTATTALVAFGLILVMPAGRDMLTPAPVSGPAPDALIADEPMVVSRAEAPSA